jgi:hypothetical protein
MQGNPTTLHYNLLDKHSLYVKRLINIQADYAVLILSYHWNIDINQIVIKQ